MNQESLLEEIGLTKSEIKVYLALLEIGSTTTGPIVDKSKIASSKIYEILEKLMQKGLASFVIKAGTKHFEAADPKRLLDYVKEKEAKIKEQERELTKILPELELKRTLSKYKSDTTVYKGEKGLETAYQDLLKTLKKGDTNYAFVVGSLDEKTNDFFKRHYKLRAKKGIKTKTIFSEAGRIHYESRKDIPLFEGKIIGTTSSLATVNIYRSKVNLRIGKSKDVVAIIIDNQELADSFLEQFNVMWNQKVETYEGQKAVEAAYNSILHSVTGKDEVAVFAARPKSKRAALFNVEWNKNIARKAKSNRLLYYGNSKENKERVKEINLVGCETKIVPTQESLPISTVIAGETILNSVWGKKPITFKIENKEVADAFRANFNLLWNQDVHVYTGFKSSTERFDAMLDRLQKGDEYYVLGLSMTSAEEGYQADWFYNFHKRRVKKGVGSLMLCDADHLAEMQKRTKYAGDEQRKLTKLRGLPPDFSSPIQINLYGKDTVGIFTWDEEFRCFEVKSKQLYSNFKKYFDVLWNQDTIVEHGFDAFERAWTNLFEEIKPGESYEAFGAAFGTKKSTKRYIEYFRRLHTKRIEKGIKSRLLFEPGRSNLIREYGLTKLYSKDLEYKTLPFKMDSPVEVFTHKDKTLLLIQKEEPTIISIKNKEVSESFKKYFESFWDQNTTIVKGFEGMLDSLKHFVDEIEKGDTFNALGATFGIKGNKQEYADIFKQYHDHRVKKGIRARLLFQPSARKTYEKNKGNYRKCDVRFLPYDTDSPVSIHPYKDKTMMIIQEKVPTTITIHNKEITQSFLKHFESMWKQEARIVSGLDAIGELFEEMLESGHCDLIGAQGYYIDQRPNHINEWERKAKKKGFTMRNIVSDKAKGHKITKFSFAKTKYTLPKEFANLSVFWIFGNKVAISNWVNKEPIVTIIENKHFHELYQKQFNSLWEKKEKKKKLRDVA